MILRVTHNPEHDLGKGNDNFTTVAREKKTFRNGLANPPHQVIVIVAKAQFLPDSINAVYVPECMAVQETVPESRANRKCVIAILGGYQHVRVDEIAGSRTHGSDNLSRRAYS